MGTLAAALAAHTLIGLDTNPFIYLWERHARYFPLAEDLFRYLTQSPAQGITSMITYIEACVHPQRMGRHDLIAAYENYLFRSRQIRLLPIDAALARRAIVLRAQYDIHVPDALQIAAAIESGATAFVTNDERLTRVQELDVLLLEHYVA